MFICITFGYIEVCVSEYRYKHMSASVRRGQRYQILRGRRTDNSESPNVGAGKLTEVPWKSSKVF